MVDICCVLEWENAVGIERIASRNYLNDLIIRLDNFGRLMAHEIELMIIYDETIKRSDLEENLLHAEALHAATIKVKFLRAPNTRYMDKKALAPHFTWANILIYADSDCYYDLGWLEQHIKTLKTETIGVSSGNTVALKSTNIVAEACTLAWFFPSEDPRDRLHSKANKRFFANNFAAKRHVLLDVPLPRLDASRAGSALWKKRLGEHQICVKKLPEAKAFHKQYDTVFDLFQRAYLLGRDKDFGVANDGAGRVKRLSRAITALFELTFKFLARFFTVGVCTLPVLHWPIILSLGLAFQWIAAVRQILCAMSKKYQPERVGYDDLIALAEIQYPYIIRSK
ncbi:hypothetical protein N9582_06175 [Amylibacter sp.]|nr:hypothetical protein [Amylibacter sp.]